MYIIVSCFGLGDSLTAKAQDQSSILRTIIHSIGGRGRQRKVDPWSLLAGQMNLLCEFQASERLCLKSQNKVDGI